MNPLASDSTSIYDMQWKDNNVILSGHYDTTFRLFDLRTNCDEHIWVNLVQIPVFVNCIHIFFSIIYLVGSI